MAENEASVTALAKRLAQSNAEVEKLQGELKHNEDSIREYRDLLSAMRSSSQLADEQIHTVMEELDTHRELVDKHQTNNLAQFESIKSILETQIEDLKLKATTEVSRLQNDLEQKSLQNDEVIALIIALILLYSFYTIYNTFFTIYTIKIFLNS